MDYFELEMPALGVARAWVREATQEIARARLFLHLQIEHFPNVGAVTG
jgi:hypothetical protein